MKKIVDSNHYNSNYINTFTTIFGSYGAWWGLQMFYCSTIYIIGLVFHAERVFIYEYKISDSTHQAKAIFCHWAIGLDNNNNKYPHLWALAWISQLDIGFCEITLQMIQFCSKSKNCYSNHISVQFSDSVKKSCHSMKTPIWSLQSGCRKPQMWNFSESLQINW